MLQTSELLKLLYRDSSSAYMTQSFGINAISSVYIYSFHTGVDLSSGDIPNPEITTPIDITITRDDNWSTTGYGNQLIGKFKGKDGNDYSLRFGHFERNFFKVGNFVKKGTVIGIEGTTGFSTGPHLHFEIFKGTINPYIYQYDKEKYLSAFINPLQLDEVANLYSSSAMPQHKVEIKNNRMEELHEMEEEIAQLKNESGELRSQALRLRSALAKAWLTNDNREDIDQFLSNYELDPVKNSPSKIGIINELYWAILGRAPDQNGMNYHKNLSVLEIVRSIAGSYEFSRRINNIIYNAVFGRNIDDSGLKTWARKTPSELIEILKNSEEYKKIIKSEYERLF